MDQSKNFAPSKVILTPHLTISIEQLGECFLSPRLEFRMEISQLFLQFIGLLLSRFERAEYLIWIDLVGALIWLRYSPNSF